MRKIVLLFILLFFVSCNERNLGKDYYCLSEYEANEYLTGSFVYKSFNENVFEKIIVYPKVKSIEFNTEYIIVLQQPNKKLMLKKIKDDLELWNNYYSENKKDSLVSLVHKKMLLSNIHKLVGSNKTEKLNITADSIFNNEIFYKKMFENKSNYYIIQKANDSIFGPLTLKGFEIIKKKKSIDLDFE